MIARPRIGLIGKAGSGKSSAAALLARELGFQHCKTGRLCREISRLAFGDEITSHLHRVSDALQTIDEGIFLKAAIRNLDFGRPIVIDAIRFHYDINYAKANQFTLVRLRTAPAVRAQRLENRGQILDYESSSSHRIETELDSVEVDFEIENEGSLCNLATLMFAIAQKPAQHSVMGGP